MVKRDDDEMFEGVMTASSPSQHQPAFNVEQKDDGLLQPLQLQQTHTQTTHSQDHAASRVIPVTHADGLVGEDDEGGWMWTQRRSEMMDERHSFDGSP